MLAGIVLLTQLTPSTSLLNAGVYMVVAGIGLGMFFSIVNLVMQNAISPQQPGVG